MMNRTWLLVLSLGLGISRYDVMSASQDSCPEGTVAFKENCLFLTTADTWLDARSRCPSLLTDITDIRERLIDLDSAKSAKSTIVSKILLLNRKEPINEVWVLEKGSLIFETKMSSSLLDPFTFSLWRWSNSTSDSTCLTLDLRSQKFRERGCASAIKLPAVCVQPKRDTNHRHRCPQTFDEDIAFNSTCVHRAFVRDIDWNQARIYCSSLGPRVTVLGAEFVEDLTTKLARLQEYCNETILPLYADTSGTTERTALNLTAGEIVSVNEKHRFKCVICQTASWIPLLDQTISLSSIGNNRLGLHLSNFHKNPQEHSELTCRTDASTSHPTSDNFNEILINIFPSSTQDNLNIVSRTKSMTDKFHVRIVGGEVASPKDEVQDISKHVTYLVRDGTNGTQTLEVSFEVNATGNYWCFGTNSKNLLPIFTDKTFIFASKNGRYMRYAVLVEHTLLLQGKIKKLVNTAESNSFISFTTELAKALHIVDGVLELKRISHSGTQLLFHATLPVDHGPLVDLVNTTLWRLLSIHSIGKCLSTNVITSTGVTYALPTLSIGATYTSDDTCMERSCEGDFMVGATWSPVIQHDCASTSLEFDVIVVPGHFLPNNSMPNSKMDFLDHEKSEEDNYGRVKTTLDYSKVTENTLLPSLRPANNLPVSGFISDTSTLSSDAESTKTYSLEQTILPIEQTLTEKMEELSTSFASEESPFLTSVTGVTEMHITTPAPESSSPPTWPTSPEDSAKWIQILAQTTVSSSQLINVAALVHNVLMNPGDIDTVRVLENLETILSKMILEDGSDFAADVHPTVATLVADYQQSNPVMGISVVADGGTDVITPIRSGSNTSYSDQSEIAVLLDQSLLGSSTRLVFVVLLNGEAFPQSNVVGRVVNVALANKTSSGLGVNFSKGQYVDIIFKKKQIPCQTPVCAFWNTAINAWSRDGCELHSQTKHGLDVCRCNHLTNFAEIITGGSDMAPGHRLALEVLSIFGSVLSLLGVLVIAVTAGVFRSWRRELGNQILVSLSAALALNLIMYLLVYGGVGGTTGAGCICVGALLHYSVLACFCWMLVMSVLQINRLLTMSGNQATPHLLLKASLFGWLVPLVFVLIALLAWQSTSYTSSTSLGFQRGFCYPCGTSFYVTLAGPLALIVLANIVIFCVIMCRICSFFGWGMLDVADKRHGISDGVMAMRRLRTLIFLFFLFGLTWTFGFLGQYLFFAYLFCILAPLQGFVIFVFFFIIESKSRTHWKSLYFGSETRKSKHLDTKDVMLLESVPLREEHRSKIVEEANGEPAKEDMTTLQRRRRETPQVVADIFASDEPENSYRSFGHPDFVEDDKNGKRFSLIESRNRNVFDTFK